MRKLLVIAACIAALAGGAAAHQSNSDDVKLQIYSNWPHPRTFLGCLNCAPSDPNSIWNRRSQYGWKNPDGVWSRPAFRHASYRRLVCDMPLTAAPPAVFDQYYGFYYVLTVDAERGGSICGLTASHQGCAVVRALCAGPSGASAPSGSRALGN